MTIKYYPDKNSVQKAIKADDPLLMLISFTKTEILLSNVDDAVEHTILLKKLGYNEQAIDSYFRVVVNKDGADWTFICPSNYKNIVDKNKRIKVFYNEGFEVISQALKEIGYNVNLNIPKRYRRHIEFIKDDNFKTLDNN